MTNRDNVVELNPCPVHPLYAGMTDREVVAQLRLRIRELGPAEAARLTWIMESYFGRDPNP